MLIGRGAIYCALNFREHFSYSFSLLMIFRVGQVLIAYKRKITSIVVLVYYSTEQYAYSNSEELVWIRHP